MAQTSIRGARENHSPSLAAISRGAGVVVLALVLFLTLGDDVARPQFIANQDKAEHAIAFLAVGLLFGWGASILSFVVFALALGATACGIEVFQATLTTTRDGSFEDAAASLSGLGAGLIGAAAMSLLWRRAPSVSSAAPSPLQ